MSAGPFFESLGGLLCEAVSAFGQVRLRAHGSSMVPTIWPGEVLIVEPARAVQVGQIVLASHGESLVAHRVVSLADAGDGVRLTTQGDSLGFREPLIPMCRVVGRITGVMRDGKKVMLESRPRPAKRLAMCLARRSRLALRILVRAHQCSEWFTGRRRARATP